MYAGQKLKDHHIYGLILKIYRIVRIA